MSIIDNCHSIEDFRRAARRRLPRSIFEYVDCGSEDQVSVRDNRAAFERLKLKTKFLVGLLNRDMGTNLLGKRIAMPLVVAPTGLAGLLTPHGELAMAHATTNVGIPTSVTFGAVTSLDRMARETTGQLLFQCHIWPKQQIIHDLIKRAASVGRYHGLIVTIDFALGRSREHNLRNGLTLPLEFNRKIVMDMATHPGWVARVILPYMMKGSLPRHANFPPGNNFVVKPLFAKGGGDPGAYQGLVWDDLRVVRDMWPGKLIIKGVLNEIDALRALEIGADAIVISNHGGRAMDSAAATIDMLPAIAKVVNKRCEIIIDGGIRRGSDIVKALALGANAVMIGRPTLFGLAAAGQAGAEKVMEILRTEFEKTMGYIGCTSVDQLGPHIFANGPRYQAASYGADADLPEDIASSIDTRADLDLSQSEVADVSSSRRARRPK